MRLILHGYARGTSLTTPEDLHRAAALDTPALEFDVCRSRHTGRPVLAHDTQAVTVRSMSLDDALTYLGPTGKTVFIEPKEPDVVAEAIECVVAHDMADRVVVFAFAPVARAFPWRDRGPVKLGLVTVFPWNVERDIDRFRPDSIVVGWGSPWERYTFHAEKYLFRVGWRLFGLPAIVRRHPRVRFVVATLRSRRELGWLRRDAEALYGIVVDPSFLAP